ncbi:ABC transporter substrate-binding protein [Hydrogenophaga sp. Root209]|uniref:tripartite tricarboxylate transporter substrate binding protein n=1 Tax=unclassified Hydrogenophaga TaxID=2610897 RepID=UPI0006F31953|nr:tripartite tricarboxylate transporter substrate binding protein [Hydrogenophaga sp. Root209]KRC11152.1 ABC transporter substrate-binding protein [Hydrogenophaga sp. Root209]
MTPSLFSPLRRTVCATALALALPAAMAWTDKPVRMVVPAPAGGTMDVVARIVAEQLQADIGQPVVVENRAGAGGAIAVQAMISAPPDGNTIMMTASNILTEIPHVMKTAFDPLKDVKPVTAIARATMVMIGAPNLPAKDLKGVIAWVKAHPGTVSFASYSAGTSSHYAGMILNQKAGLDMQHVPFAGSPPALAQVMGNQIPLMFDGMATARNMINSGKVQAYGVASKQRSQHLPNVPTLAELGYPELDFSNWVGIIVSASVPAAMVDKINAAVDKAAASPKVRDRLLGAGFDAGGDETAEQMARSLRADFERNATIVKTFDIKLTQ